jgi:hypothetical protein
METRRKVYEPQFKLIPLNSDAFHMDISQIPVGMEQEYQKDKDEVIRACLRMKDEALSELIHDLNNIDEDPLSSDELKKVMHKRGLPLRYLGKICSHAALNHTREIAVIEIISRAA